MTKIRKIDDIDPTRVDKDTLYLCYTFNNHNISTMITVPEILKN